MKKTEKISFSTINEKLNKKIYPTKFITGVSTQVLFVWKNESLIPLYKPVEKGWNKYSLVDILWIGIIEELKKFGFTNEKIISIKNQLLVIDEIIENEQDKGEEIEILNLAIIEIFKSANPIYIIIDENGNTQVLNAYAIIDKMQANKLTNHIILNLNQLIKLNIEALYEEPSLDEFKGLSKDELQVLLILRSENFESVKIIKKGGEIDTIESTEIVSNGERILNILKGHDYQHIEIKQARGKIVQIKRTIKERT
ncbi:MerR family transcriptional regulator [Kordia algicida OT-1]|uniref:DNA-directed RNA polymerase subunit beta n=1 Tax=Kordia algicida OT-1 TaxID=391587 RepID=A9E226_9FLAO|nr:MerR family transcriptional regulator [Kordia algicida]EDP95706.1 DNA-directed RNA polymerase subunit beta' [Kordia algicida OT-1]